MARGDDKAKYKVGDKLYFCPSLSRMPHGSAIPAGMVTVEDVIDHGLSTPQSCNRWSYVVTMGVGGRQGAAEDELHVWPQS